MNNVLEVISKFDVVFMHNSFEAQFLLPALPSHIIRFSVAHNTDHSTIELAKLNSNFLDCIIGVSPDVTKKIIESFHKECPIEMIPNGTEVVPSRLSDLRKPLRLIYVGRLQQYQKNILLLPEIAKILVSNNIDFKFTIVGDGEQRSELERKIRQMGLDGLIEIKGFVEKEKIVSYFEENDFSIIPSNFEGFGLTLIESMAAGCVPVTSDLSVFSWILGDDLQFLQAKPNVARAYFEIIMRLVSSKEELLTTKKKIRARVESEFTADKMVCNYDEIIKKYQILHKNNNFPEITIDELPKSIHMRLQFTYLWKMMQIMKDNMLLKR
jgi:glycosyltransferase involved in cell wall biosynthesis